MSHIFLHPRARCSERAGVHAGRCGHGQIKSWSSQAAFVGIHEQGAQSEQACMQEDVAHRTEVQNKLAGVCVDMCKEVGAFPKCTCPDFVAPDSTPGVMTWPELL